MVRNVANPVIATTSGELRLARRIVAGLAFRPDNQWGIFLDIDVVKGDLFHNGHTVQPVSLGVEKGFFQNKFFLRAGFLNDLSDKYFFGRNANILLRNWLGIQSGKFSGRFRAGLIQLGHVKNLAISGFYLIK